MKPSMVTLIVSLGMCLGACNEGRGVDPPAHAGAGVCTQDAKVCPDGGHVSRNPANNCAFDACPTHHTRPTPRNGNTYTNRLIPYGCPTDSMRCPDGSSVMRVPANNCSFAPCP